MTPNGTVSTSGQHSVEMNSSSTASVSFKITVTAQAGRTLTAFKTPNVDDLCAFKTVEFGAAASAIDGEDVTGSTYYRWPVTNVIGLRQGMLLDPARGNGSGAVGLNTTTPATISSYQTTKTSLEITNTKYGNDVEVTTVDDVFVDAVTRSASSAIEIDRNGNLTLQTGDIVFNTQQADALKSDSGVRIFGYGANNIKSLTGVGVSLSNIVLTPSTTNTSTTTTSTSVNRAAIAVAEVAAISSASTVSGVNINASVANPTVVSKSTTSGAGTITISSAQTLESGQTLNFSGASDILTITGDIELTMDNGFISNQLANELTLFFDVERFITSV